MDLNAATKVLREKVGSDSGLGTTLKFDCGSEGIVLIDGAAVPNTVSNSDGDAACTIALSLDTLNRLILGELEPTTAFMMGKLKVSGDMSVAMKLQHLL
ncbi:MAG TPA: SCP2 sterol-binding domain-containing protein [Ideonella sp.]|jgi:putative sterol carrier protein|uniref:SCP2 sterol-binding domain-containing protein n=1 Tax=Ideonella sp. TaxID=1929293 RepID=UPI002E319D24|nr:SCP2 sterol-binding domain-containing protein [Ideonella sp.]HEX5685495.1 SCP2 sterol-binding domain-containing protein [Ideonella sp.]